MKKRGIKKLMIVCMWISCIIITIFAINKINKDRNFLYDYSKIEEKIDELRQSNNIDYLSPEEIDLYENEFAVKDIPEKGGYEIVVDVDFDRCQSNMRDRVNAYMAEEDVTGNYIKPDSNGNYEEVFKNYFGIENGYKRVLKDVERFSGSMKIEDITNDKLSDVEYITSNSISYEIAYNWTISKDDIDKYYSDFTMDQKIYMAYLLECSNGKCAMDISENQQNFYDFTAVVKASMRDTPATMLDVISEFDQRMNSLGIEYVIKEIKAYKMKNLQYYCLETGNEEINRYVLFFDTCIDGIETLSYISKLDGPIGIETGRGWCCCDFEEDYISDLAFEGHEPSEKLYDVEIKKSVNQIYDEFVSYVDESYKGTNYKEIHVDDISVKYVECFYEWEYYIVPAYVVTTTELKYDFVKEKWTRECVEYLFGIEGAEYYADIY